MTVDKILKVIIRIVILYFILNHFNVYALLFWIPVIYFLFLFPNFLLKYLKLEQWQTVLKKHNISICSEENAYRLLIYIGLIPVVGYIVLTILNFIFPSYFEYLDQNVINYKSYNLKYALIVIGIIIFTYSPLVIFNTRLSDYLSSKEQNNGHVTIFFRVFFRICFMYILIKQLYQPLFNIFDYTNPDHFNYFLKWKIKDYFINLAILIITSFFLLFQPKILIKLLGINQIQKYIVMNNINLFEERVIYRIALLGTSFFILFKYITFFQALISDEHFSPKPLWAKYDFWSALIIITVNVLVIKYNQKIADFLVKN